MFRTQAAFSPNIDTRYRSLPTFTITRENLSSDRTDAPSPPTRRGSLERCRGQRQSPKRGSRYKQVGWTVPPRYIQRAKFAGVHRYLRIQHCLQRLRAAEPSGRLVPARRGSTESGDSLPSPLTFDSEQKIVCCRQDHTPSGYEMGSYERIYRFRAMRRARSARSNIPTARCDYFFDRQNCSVAHAMV